MAALIRLVRARFSPPKPSTASFEGQTVLITAATGGLGLEAAKKLAVQGTSNLIITGRDKKKGAIAKAAIEAHLKSHSKKSINIIPLVLEMSDPSAIHAFVADLKTHTTHLDHAILNAGLVQTSHTLSRSNYELALQVNTISTTILGILILPLLLASPLTTEPSVSSRPHLSFVSSGTAWSATLESIRPLVSSSDKPLTALSLPSAFPAGTMGGGAQYGRTKLFLEYCIRPLAFLPSLLSDPSDPKSSPKVLVTSTCPGMCRSDLARQYTGISPIISFLSKIMMFMIAKTAAAGANSYITSLEVGVEGRGEQWKDDRFYVKESERNVRSEEGKALGEKVWREMREYAVAGDREGVVSEVLGEGKKRQ